MGHAETGRILIVTAGGRGWVPCGVFCVHYLRSERRVEPMIDRVQSLGSQSFRRLPWSSLSLILPFLSIHFCQSHGISDGLESVDLGA
jgi:hypothetical protein